MIEDQQDMVEVLSLATDMRWPGATVMTTRWGEKGVEMARTAAPDLVILDLGLPDMDGFVVLEQIRSFSSVPVIILTVRHEQSDILKGIKLGADDYIVKPFRHPELLGRVDALTGRSHTQAEQPRLSCGPLYFDPPSRLLRCRGKVVPITATEADILCELMKRAGSIVSNANLAQAVWGDYYPGADDCVKAHIKRLHAKIEVDPSKPTLILSQPGAGYLMLDNTVTL